MCQVASRRLSFFLHRRLVFESRSVKFWFVVDRLDLEVSRNPSLFLCIYHFTAVPYSFMCHLRDGQRPVSGCSSTQARSDPITTVAMGAEVIRRGPNYMRRAVLLDFVYYFIYNIIKLRKLNSASLIRSEVPQPGRFSVLLFSFFCSFFVWWWKNSQAFEDL
jgi:hypothetical protein